jgi:hypothetical protein
MHVYLHIYIHATGRTDTDTMNRTNGKTDTNVKGRTDTTARSREIDRVNTKMDVENMLNGSMSRDDSRVFNTLYDEDKDSSPQRGQKSADMTDERVLPIRPNVLSSLTYDSSKAIGMYSYLYVYTNVYTRTFILPKWLKECGYDR